jgi:ribonuclease-3
MPADLQELETRLGHVFTDRDLLVRAVTHRSFLSDQKPRSSPPPPDNEQLEFLGDAVLGFLVSEWLLRQYPAHREGRLSKLKHHLVSAHRLYEVAVSLDLGAFLSLGRGEELSGGRKKRSLLANALEAAIAALYLDGGIEPARRFVVERIIDPIFDQALDAELYNYKGALEERAKATRLSGPRYAIVEEKGPAHSKTFVVEARVGDMSSQGAGPSKKSAAQRAAKGILEQMNMVLAGSGLRLEVQDQTGSDRRQEESHI